MGVLNVALPTLAPSVTRKEGRCVRTNPCPCLGVLLIWSLGESSETRTDNWLLKANLRSAKARAGDRDKRQQLPGGETFWRWGLEGGRGERGHLRVVMDKVQRWA